MEVEAGGGDIIEVIDTLLVFVNYFMIWNRVQKSRRYL